MSAFVCNYITFSRVAEVVQMEYKHKTIDKDQLVNELYQMNIRAYNAIEDQAEREFIEEQAEQNEQKKNESTITA